MYSIYSYFYPEEIYDANPRQKHLKHLLMKQILDSSFKLKSTTVKATKPLETSTSNMLKTFNGFIPLLDREIPTYTIPSLLTLKTAKINLRKKKFKIKRIK